MSAPCRRSEGQDWLNAAMNDEVILQTTPCDLPTIPLPWSVGWSGQEWQPLVGRVSMIPHSSWDHSHHCRPPCRHGQDTGYCTNKYDHTMSNYYSMLCTQPRMMICLQTPHGLVGGGLGVVVVVVVVIVAGLPGMALATYPTSGRRLTRQSCRSCKGA
jgi:hypothetical protein